MVRCVPNGRVLARALALFIFAISTPALAAGLVVRVDDGQAPLADAVVSLHGPSPSSARGKAVMDQRNTAFLPGVLPIQAGTAVSFPNSDSVRHQVYSFSAPRPFELPLYSGTPPEPVVFDKPGVVVVGCNIHDWMIGHIVVLDTPYFGKSGADGRVALSAPAGEYTLRAWHPRLAGGPWEQAVTLGEGTPEVKASLALGPPPPERRGSDRLRALQDRLRKLKQDE
ncbi:methylamine utilization protein [bacterium BD-1]|uniref:methylamine utilization protein n=1 Tax=Arenimonas sp. TaxID=1872635 RepID=UPI001E5BC408|nr:methylamine utilization protein [Ottowia caeni]